MDVFPQNSYPTLLGIGTNIQVAITQSEGGKKERPTSVVFSKQSFFDRYENQGLKSP